jgi:hypothetical protein
MEILKNLETDLLCVIFREIQIEKKAVFVLYLIGINKLFKKSVDEIPLRYFLCILFCNPAFCLQQLSSCIKCDEPHFTGNKYRNNCTHIRRY